MVFNFEDHTNSRSEVVRWVGYWRALGQVVTVRYNPVGVFRWRVAHWAETKEV
jgi:hypothetical protein